MINRTPLQLERLKEQLVSLRNDALLLEQNYADELDRVQPGYRDSAKNLLHYLGVRQHDIRELQQDLASLGLSSLGVLEPHTLASLNSDIAILEQLTNCITNGFPPPPVDFHRGPLLLREHTKALLGVEPQERFVRIMVTMPAEAATDGQLVEDLLLAGMNVMRINCAHDGPEEWAAMVSNLRFAERKVGRSCRVQADLAGPKLRTGTIHSNGRVLKIRPKRDTYGDVIVHAKLWLTPAESPETPSDPACFVVKADESFLDKFQTGDRIHFSDTRGKNRQLKVTEKINNSFIAETDKSAYIEEGTQLQLIRNTEPVDEGRISGIPEIIRPIRLFQGDVLILTRADEPGRAAELDEEGNIIRPAQIHCTLEAAFLHIEPGQCVWFDDGKIGGIVKQNSGDNITVEISRTRPKGGKLRADKGINFPGISFQQSALTDKDIDDLRHIVKLVDMVALSFLRTPDDVTKLQDELHNLNADHLGIVLKIENVEAFKSLPHILLASLQSKPVGVMVARGDLAVEAGFERLSELQQEILWLCEAAHIPVIWATQILEGMVKKGFPSRAEVSDAAMSIMAECAMLNKGPNIVESVRFLSGIISRMDDHYVKRRATLRRLSVAQL